MLKVSGTADFYGNDIKCTRDVPELPKPCEIEVSSGFEVLGAGFRVSEFGIRVSGHGFRVSGSGFQIHPVGRRGGALHWLHVVRLHVGGQLCWDLLQDLKWSLGAKF